MIACVVVIAVVVGGLTEKVARIVLAFGTERGVCAVTPVGVQFAGIGGVSSVAGVLVVQWGSVTETEFGMG